GEEQRQSRGGGRSARRGRSGGVTRTVTSLRERKRGKVEVELDGEPWRVLPAAVVVRAELRVGRRLDREPARLRARELRRRNPVGSPAEADLARDSRGRDRRARAGGRASAQSRRRQGADPGDAPPARRARLLARHTR